MPGVEDKPSAATFPCAAMDVTCPFEPTFTPSDERRPAPWTHTRLAYQKRDGHVGERWTYEMSAWRCRSLSLASWYAALDMSMVGQVD